jgi:hypothetical protein
MSTFVLSEAPFAPLMLLQLLLAAWAWRSDTPRGQLAWALAAGATAGAATLMRPSWLLFTPLAAAVACLDADQRPRAVRIGMGMLLALSLVMAPWWIRNAVVTGHFVPTTLQVGESLYDGWNPQATGASDMGFVDEFRNACVSRTPSRESRSGNRGCVLNSGWTSGCGTRRGHGLGLIPWMRCGWRASSSCESGMSGPTIPNWVIGGSVFWCWSVTCLCWLAGVMGHGVTPDGAGRTSCVFSRQCTSPSCTWSSWDPSVTVSLQCWHYWFWLQAWPAGGPRIRGKNIQEAPTGEPVTSTRNLRAHAPRFAAVAGAWPCCWDWRCCAAGCCFSGRWQRDPAGSRTAFCQPLSWATM